MKIRFRLLLLLVVTLALAAASMLAAPIARSDSPKNNILARALDIELGRVQPRPHEQLLSSGVVYDLLGESGELDRRANAAVAALSNSKPTMSFPIPLTQGCVNFFFSGASGLNVRVNQDCSSRRQAEEVIAINPTNPLNLIAGQNDSRIGFNHCGYDWSFDGGKTWGDQIPPFYQFQMADGHTADACSDPTATFDADGNAYIGGVLFDVASAASAFVVAKSNAGIGGAFYHTPAPLSFQTYRDTPLGVVASDNDPNVFHDKEFIVADASKSSPKKNNVYATWTRFSATDSPIYFSQSTDGGATWSPGIEISGANPTYCTVGSGSANPNACDQDQGSDPIVGSDGTIYVSFGNGNTSGVGINQVMLVSCPATQDCTQASSWTTPSKVGDLVGTHPFSTSNGCPGGRQCLPPNGYRVPEFTSISASVDNNGKLYVVWADFRNGGGTCVGAGATPPCDNDVFYAYSTNGGAAWSATYKITPAGSAQWQPWSAVTSDGKSLWVAYYDRSYGNCEFDGCNDITLVRIKDTATASPKITYKRITTSSMPNLTPANNPLEAGFLGDYMWVAVDGRGQPHVVWADTRGRNGTVEEDIYFYKGNTGFGFGSNDDGK